jgi:hypothetical protein
VLFVPFRLEGFANAHAKGVTIDSLSNVGSQIDVILLAQLKPQPPPPPGKNLLFSTN